MSKDNNFEHILHWNCFQSQIKQYYQYLFLCKTEKSAKRIKYVCFCCHKEKKKSEILSGKRLIKMFSLWSLLKNNVSWHNVLPPCWRHLCWYLSEWWPERKAGKPQCLKVCLQAAVRTLSLHPFLLRVVLWLEHAPTRCTHKLTCMCYPQFSWWTHEPPAFREKS